MDNTAESVAMISEQMRDILESMGATVQRFELDYKEIPNAFGGNPQGLTTFNATINHIPYKTARLIWQRHAETEEDYINSIRAYMFNVLDGVANL